MVKKDVKAVHQLLAKYLEKSPIHIEFNEGEIEHFLVPREGVINSYVVEDENTK